MMMAPARRTDDDANLPWWQRVLEKQGFTTLFALFACFIGYDLAQAHKDYLNRTCSAVERLTTFSSDVYESHRKFEVLLAELRNDQQRTGAMMLEALREIAMASPKNAPAAPIGSDSGA